MEQIAAALNNELAGQDYIQSVSYDGQDLVFSMSPDMISADDSALFEAVTDPDSLKPVLMAEVMGELDAQTRDLFVTILETCNANLRLKVPLKNGKTFDFVITPDDFRNL